ncbi:extracellular solute-binding protein (family 3) [Alteromonadaceae bacterium 2753L.S.0a.02]|nr:extracellular solute-binding protein (family 3) [Alteromonadaceae bacterium 2753L.S.0a.02]
MLTCMCEPAHGGRTPIKIPIQSDQREKFPDRLILEAIKRGEKYEPVFPYGDISSLPLSTRINGVRNGELDIFFGLTTADYENEFQAIYIPLYRGMMGMRLAIVKRGKSELFKDVRSLEDLRRFSAGQGKFWADSDILEHNGVPLVRELKYHNLFRMLEADRFDYFPRGMHEPWSEISTHRALNLVVDEHIMLWYTVPFYFFVNKSNVELAAHLTEQIEKMIADGSFTRMFQEDSDVQQALAQANLSQREIIRLENPFLTPQTPLERKELWFDPELGE